MMVSLLHCWRRCAVTGIILSLQRPPPTGGLFIMQCHQPSRLYPPAAKDASTGACAIRADLNIVYFRIQNTSLLDVRPVTSKEEVQARTGAPPARRHLLPRRKAWLQAQQACWSFLSARHPGRARCGSSSRIPSPKMNAALQAALPVLPWRRGFLTSFPNPVSSSGFVIRYLVSRLSAYLRRRR